MGSGRRIVTKKWREKGSMIGQYFYSECNQQFMPHFNFMKDIDLLPSEEYFFRAAIHIVEVPEILQKGDFVHAIAVLYDAMINAMRFSVVQSNIEPPGEDEEVAKLLDQKFPTEFSFIAFKEEMERVIDGEEPTSNLEDTYHIVKMIIQELGIPIFESLDQIVAELGKYGSKNQF